MPNPLPNSLALTTINTNAQIISSDHRNNYAAIQAAANLIRACLAGGSAGQLLQAVDGTDVQWIPPPVVARKTTAKQVVNTVTETDLLNGEITVGAAAMGSNGMLRLTASGDLINNTGANQALMRLKVKLGATTIFDTNALPAASWAASASRWGWRIGVEIMNLGATNSQWSTLDGRLTGALLSPNLSTFTTGEGQYAEVSNGLGAPLHVVGEQRRHRCLDRRERGAQVVRHGREQR